MDFKKPTWVSVEWVQCYYKRHRRLTMTMKDGRNLRSTTRPSDFSCDVHVSTRICYSRMGQFSHTQTKKCYGLILANPSGQFSGDYISAIRGAAPQIFRAVVHPPITGTGSPKNVLLQIFKFWPKIQRLSPYSFHTSGNILTKLLHKTWWTWANDLVPYR